MKSSGPREFRLKDGNRRSLSSLPSFCVATSESAPFGNVVVSLHRENSWR